MKKFSSFLLIGFFLFSLFFMGGQLVAAQTPTTGTVDQALGQPAPGGAVPAGAEVPAGNTLALLDDFNRADGAIGPNWTVHDGYCNVSNNAAVCGGPGRATFNGAPGDGNFAEADIAVNGTSLQYTGLLLNYGAGINNLFIKVQEQSPYDGRFTHGACYTGIGGGSFGLGFFPLTSLFSTAHMAATRVGDTVTIEFTNIDSGGQPDQTYVCTGAPAPEGTGIGILGYAGIARLDNFGLATPDISVDPLSLYASQPPDNLTTQQLNICNTGDAPLDWEISELPVLLGGATNFVPVSVTGADGMPAGLNVSSNMFQLGTPAAPANPEAVLWDQPLSAVNQAAYVNQEFPDYPTSSSFLADDFTNADPWSISSIFVPGDGWNGFTSLFNATALTWQIYGDDGGVPDGDPSGAGDPPLWTLTLPPTDAQVVITNGTPGGLPSNTQLNLDSPLVLPPGTYWLVFYPTLDFTTYGQHGRQPADTTNGYFGQFVNPGGAFGFGTVWQNWTVLGLTQQDIAFRLEGEVVPFYDIPWLSESPITGTLPAGDCQLVDVTFDSTGLAPGDYFGELEIESNDPDTPEVVVPVELNVFIPPIVWDKYINGEPWYPDMNITVQTSDTIVVEEVLHLSPPGGPTAAAAVQPAVDVWREAAQGTPETLSGLKLPAQDNTPVGSPVPLQNPGLLYLTSLDIGDLTFAVYDPATDSWTALTPYETGAQMAVSTSGQLYAYGFSTGTIDVYDPATDTWSPVMPAPPGASGQYGNLEITNMGEFLYTESLATTLWYTSGGVWNTIALPFTANVMGDYDPTTDQYVIGHWGTTNAHMIDVHSFAITDYTSPVGNGEYARFSVVMGNRYYFEAGGSNIHYFDLSNPAAPPVDTGVNWGYYSSAAGDRAHNVVFNAGLDSVGLILYDATANTLSPLTGYGMTAWHSSVAYVAASEPQSGFAQVEYWDPAHLQLLDWAATGGQVDVGPDSLIWTGEILEPTTITLTKWFHVEPCTWTQTILWEELWLDGVELEQRPVIIDKLPAALWIDAVYDPNVYAGQEAYFTLNYGNTGGYENDVMIRNEFPAEAPFVSSVPMPDRQDPGGLWAEWDVGDLAMDATGSIEVTVMVQPDVPAQTLIGIWDGIFDHLGVLADEVFIEFVVLPTVDLGVTKEAPAEVYLGDTFTYTVIVTNLGPAEATDILIEDTLPVSVTYVSDNLGCSYTAGVLSCEVASLTVDESVTLTIVVMAEETSAVINTVEAWAAEDDPDAENNTASAETLINPVGPDVFYYFVPVVYKN